MGLLDLYILFKTSSYIGIYNEPISNQYKMVIKRYQKLYMK